MLLVCDANVLFAAIIKDGKTRALLADERIRLATPSTMVEELARHRPHIVKRSGKDEVAVARTLEALLTFVYFREPSASSMRRALEISPDPDDVPYLALALDLRCALWSNDRRLKEQDIVCVLTTAELLGTMHTS